jgi:hypothetical protein
MVPGQKLQLPPQPVALRPLISASAFVARRSAWSHEAPDEHS